MPQEPVGAYRYLSLDPEYVKVRDHARRVSGAAGPLTCGCRFWLMLADLGIRKLMRRTKPERRVVVTFVTPNQYLTSGGVYAIHQFAQHCTAWVDVNLVVETNDPQPVPGVTTYGRNVIDQKTLPRAHALIIAADDPDAVGLLELPFSAGQPVLLFQGYGTPGSPTVMANLDQFERVIATATWLVAEAACHGCDVELVRCGMDRSIFFPGPPSNERKPSIVMHTSHVDWKGSADGLKAFRIARNELADLDATFFGDLDPEIPDAPFLSMASRGAIADTMRRAMILVCPSWEEGFGLPGAEAMLCGAAVATTDTKGSRDYALHEQTALVSAPRDPVALAENIVRFSREPPLRTACVGRAQQLMSRTYADWPASANAFVTALKRLVVADGRRPAAAKR